MLLAWVLRWFYSLLGIGIRCFGVLRWFGVLLRDRSMVTYGADFVI